MLIVKWKKELEWKIKVSGSKNATLPILWAVLLLKWKVKLKWVPKIWDVITFLEILSWIWVKYNFQGNDLNLDSSNLNQDNLDLKK